MRSGSMEEKIKGIIQKVNMIVYDTLKENQECS